MKILLIYKATSKHTFIDQKTNRMKIRDLLIIAMVTFLTVLAWIVFAVYHQFMTSTLTTVQIEESAPLTPKFDEAILKQLENR